MSTIITHAKVSAKSDGGDATLVRPSDWNADHVVEGAIPTGFIGATVYHNTTESKTTGTTTDVAFNSEDFDTDGFHDNTTNNNRLTIPAGLGGKYLILYHLHVAALTSATPQIDSNIKKNGTTSLRGSEGGESNNTGVDLSSQEINGHAIADLAAGDYITVELYTTDTVTIGHASGSGIMNTFSITKLDSGKVGSGVGAKAVETAAQTLTNTVAAAITFNDTDAFDTDEFHDTGSNTSRMTIPAGMAGKYLLIGTLGFVANATGVRVLSFRKNGAATDYGLVLHTPTASAYTSTPAVAVLDLAAGDYVELFASQDSGGNLNTTGEMSFSIMRLDSGSVNNVATDAIWDAAGDLAVGTGANTAARLASGAAGTVLTGAGVGSAPTWAAASGGLLGVNVYSPATRSLYTTASATLADVDATNMVVTFTAPASGNVIVRLSAWCDLAVASWFYWSLRESTTDIGTPVLVQRSSMDSYVSIPIYLTGISAGSHTYKWSFATDGTGGQNGRVWAGAGNSSGQESGPAVMEVFAAP